jgi:demethylmenaquinone methyltransferase/2-methoxy-6-polyprenyl-1,4-benzoquinol methylase
MGRLVVTANENLTHYYARRAREYEKIYHKPERQQDLAELQVILLQLLAERNVLEIACGTGYWTEHIATRAASLLATDINDEVLELAQAKEYPRHNVTFLRTDAFAPVLQQGIFNGGFAGFWWSHVEKQRLPEFLQNFHQCLTPGALVVFLDNAYVEGSSTPLADHDEYGNTYQRRALDDGSQHRVLKNFPAEHELRTLLQPLGFDLSYRRLPYYWLISYRIR